MSNKKETTLTGFNVINSSRHNKGTAFTKEERELYKLRGLLPPKVVSPEIQIERTLNNLRRKQDDIEKYIYLTALQARNERLFYRLLIDNIEEILKTLIIRYNKYLYDKISSELKTDMSDIIHLHIVKNNLYEENNFISLFVLPGRGDVCTGTVSGNVL